MFVGTNGIVVDNQNRVLLILRDDTRTWAIPGGALDPGELPTNGVTREVKEETGLDVDIRSILNVVSNQLTPKLHTLAIVLLASVTGGELCADDDIETLEWISLSGPLPEMAFEADEHIIERYAKTKLKGAPVDPGFASHPRMK